MPDSPHQLIQVPPAPRPKVAVVSAAGARDADAQTIATLPDSYTLMQRAAQSAADWISARSERSAAVFVGPGNNGGDGWLIAGLLRERGWTVTVHAAGDPRTGDAQRAKGDALRAGAFGAPSGTEPVLVDALLGTGASGAPRGEVALALDMLRVLRNRSTTPVLIAIDIPSSLDASTGNDDGAVAADITLTFGTVKRGQLLRRDLTGELQVLDIGLVDSAVRVPRVVDAGAVRSWLPTMAADAWKGTRGRLAVVGGEQGMAGAVVLAVQGAHASGVGMVRADVAAESLIPLQVAAPFATVRTWRAHDWSGIDAVWPDAMVIGPGLDGSASWVRASVLSLLHEYRGPVVLDAGALRAFHWLPVREIDETDVADGTETDPLDALRHALRGRPALLTPHVGEFAGLFAPGTAPMDRFDAPLVLAKRLNATILLKGVPTVIVTPDGECLVSAAGNPALAMGGTGDLLAGIAGALLAQGLAPLQAGAAAAWTHGAAAERACVEHGTWRGVTMARLLHEVTEVWPATLSRASIAGASSSVLLTLPAVPSQ